MISSIFSEDDRVVVTGIGCIGANFKSTRDFLDVLQQGRSGITKWHQQDPKILSKIGGDLSQFNTLDHFYQNQDYYSSEYVSKAKKLLKITPFSGQITIVAALEAYIMSGLKSISYDPQRFGHILAGHNLNGNYTLKNSAQFFQDPEFVDGLFCMLGLDTDILALISDFLQLESINCLASGSSASGNIGMILAYDSIRAGRADIMLVTGAATDIDPLTLQSMAFVQAMSINSFNDTPELASRPFDALREGFVPAHGAGCIILERYSHAKKRNAQILAEFCGGAFTSDAARTTHPNVLGQSRAMELALQNSRLNKDQINYINAHATSSVIGDISEVNAIKSCFKDLSYNLKVNATKSIIGHCLFSSGTIEAIATILQINNKFLHPTINQQVKDPILDLDFVPNISQDYKVKYALSNAFGFGGINSSIILKNWNF